MEKISWDIFENVCVRIRWSQKCQVQVFKLFLLSFQQCRALILRPPIWYLCHSMGAHAMAFLTQKSTVKHIKLFIRYIILLYRFIRINFRFSNKKILKTNGKKFVFCLKFENEQFKQIMLHRLKINSCAILKRVT